MNSIVSLRKAMITASLPFAFLENPDIIEFFKAVGVKAPDREEFKVEMLQINANSFQLIRE
jgi:hypothetical protein